MTVTSRMRNNRQNDITIHKLRAAIDTATGELYPNMRSFVELAYLPVQHDFPLAETPKSYER